MYKIQKISFIILIFGLCFLNFLEIIESNVIGIDIGTESFKVATIKGTIELVLNPQSSRKTANVVGFSNTGERLFGVSAANLATRFPSQVYPAIQQLLGLNYDENLAHELNQFYGYTLLEDPQRGTFRLAFKDNNQTFAPEELIAMILQQAQTFAKNELNYLIRDCVITIPSYWNDAQRQALIDAAKVAQLNVLLLVPDVSAVAVQYALSRDISPTETNIIFYDMGAGSTKAVLVTYSTISDPKKANKTIPQVVLKYNAWDRSLGGRNFDYRLAYYLAKKASSQFKIKLEEITLNKKVFAKLIKEARSIKEILSANQQAVASIESLINDNDFRLTIKRSEFEELCSDLFDQALKPIQEILEHSKLELANISAVELIGGGMRIPKIQENLKKFLNRKTLDFHLNSDESAVFGSTFLAAIASTTLRVQTDIRIKDIINYPILLNVDLSNQEKTELNTTTEDDTIENHNSTIFRRGSRIPSKKNLSLKTSNDFTVKLSYDLSESSNIIIGKNPIIKEYYVSGIPSNKTNKYSNMVDKAKVHITISLTSSGIVEISKAEAEIIVLVPKKIISNENQTASTKNGTDNSSNTSETSKNVENNNDNNANINENETNTSTSNAKIEYIEKIQRVTLNVTLINSNVIPLSSKELFNYSKTLIDLNTIDENRRKLEEARNSLESYIYSSYEIIDNNDFIDFSTEQERQDILTKANELSEWLESIVETTVIEYKQKYNQIFRLRDKIDIRIKEFKGRAKAILQLENAIQRAKFSLENITNIRNVTQDEVDQVLEIAKEYDIWIKMKSQQQISRPQNEDPIFYITDIQSKEKELISSTTRLLRRPIKKIPTPTPTSTPSSSSSSSESKDYDNDYNKDYDKDDDDNDNSNYQNNFEEQKENLKKEAKEEIIN
eukprot:TRINITY_DN925_c1_g1_i2.p1 TRINITY_DN925_c1_g1~~TRINITY_DN925_c1_g1_i2.p1  ORF type:complete len:899 (+),score=400.27 TRINITY_DN925_c1_g1_i2:41-2737(+)